MDQKKQVEELSKSKAKRIERQKEVAMKKKKKTATRIIWGVVIAAVVVVVGVFAGLSIYRASKITASNANYSAGLLDDGLIENVNVSECVKLADYENHIIPLDEVKATDEEIEQSINSTLNSHKELSEDTSLEVVDGDKVNIDFVGTVDVAEEVVGDLVGVVHDGDVAGECSGLEGRVFPGVIDSDGLVGVGGLEVNADGGLRVGCERERQCGETEKSM